MAEVQCFRVVFLLRAEQVFCSKFFCLVQLGLPVLKAAVKLNGVCKLKEIQISSLIQGMKLFLVKEVAALGKGR